MIMAINGWLERRKKNIKVWKFCNVYDTAVIGRNVSIGSLTEVGHAVKIGDNVRIGSGCFLCEGVEIKDNAFLAAHVVFTNDKYPPSPRERWLQTYVGRGASIGAGTTIVCGVSIGDGATVGAGSVVTRSIPAGETWAGNPARKLKTRD